MAEVKLVINVNPEDSIDLLINYYIYKKDMTLWRY